MADSTKPDGEKTKTFGDSWVSLALMIAFIVLGRTYLAEPFKIPTGSMEPTLIGHEEFGDRIVTNKLAYISGLEAWFIAGAFLVLILQGLIWAVEYTRGKMAAQYPAFGVVIGLVALRFFRGFRSPYYLPLFDYAGLALFALLAIHTVYWYARNFSVLKEHKGRVRNAVYFLLLVFVPMGYAWTQNAIAGEPRRFDVPVFEFDDAWQGGEHKDINYIKRLTGLPGEQILISGGDLFLYDKKAEKYNIIRKWQERGDALQDELWFPVSRAFESRYSDPYPIDRAESLKLIADLEKLDKKDAAASVAARLLELKIILPKDATAEDLIGLLKESLLIKDQLRDLKFPWAGADDGTAGAKLEEKALVLDGSAPIDLKFKFPITNIYMKQGRWQFKHSGCPMSHLKALESSDGMKWRNPNSVPEDVDAVVSNTWDGMQCPNCKQVFFPIDPGSGTFVPHPLSYMQSKTRFAYGGEANVGDLKVEMKLEVESFGSLHIEVGNTLRRAVWNIPGGGEADTDDGIGRGKLGKSHFVRKQTAALTPGAHTISLAYVDGTVIAYLDGQEVDRNSLNVIPLSQSDQRQNETLASVKLTGVKGRVTGLNVSRDLYWTTVLKGQGSMLLDRAEHDIRPNVSGIRSEYDVNNNLMIRVEDDSYLMMGDNSPGSSDSRVWGRVPRERIMGRAWVVFWPVSHWKVIK